MSKIINSIMFCFYWYEYIIIKTILTNVQLQIYDET